MAKEVANDPSVDQGDALSVSEALLKKQKEAAEERSSDGDEGTPLYKKGSPVYRSLQVWVEQHIVRGPHRQRGSGEDAPWVSCHAPLFWS